MLNKNFLQIVTSSMKCAGNTYSPSQISNVKHKTIQGTVKVFSDIGGAMAMPAHKMSRSCNFAAVRSGSLYRNATFAFGSGTTAPTLDDYVLETPIDDTNFTPINANIQNPTDTVGMENACILSQIWRYDGTSEITINEIGWYAMWGDSGDNIVMLDRTVLDNPITVNNGDTFTIALTIGGKATAQLNS